MPKEIDINEPQISNNKSLFIMQLFISYFDSFKTKRSIDYCMFSGNVALIYNHKNNEHAKVAINFFFRILYSPKVILAKSI